MAADMRTYKEQVEAQSARTTDNAAAGSGKSSSTLVENDPAPQRPTPATPAFADLVSRLRAADKNPTDVKSWRDLTCEAADALERQQARIAEFEQDAAWIAVTDHLPEKDGVYLTHRQGDAPTEVQPSIFSKGRWLWGDGTEDNSYPVEYWRHFPLPPIDAAIDRARGEG